MKTTAEKKTTEKRAVIDRRAETERRSETVVVALRSVDAILKVVAAMVDRPWRNPERRQL